MGYTRLPFSVAPQLTSLWMDCLNTDQFSTLIGSDGTEWLQIKHPKICDDWHKKLAKQVAEGTAKWDAPYCWEEPGHDHSITVDRSRVWPKNTDSCQKAEE